MKSIIIIGNKDLLIDKIEEIEFNGFAEMHRVEEKKLLTLEFSSGRVYFNYDEDIALDYEQDELDRISMKNPRFIAINFSSIEALKKVLSELYIFDGLLVDDDHGNIVDLNTYMVNMQI